MTIDSHQHFWRYDPRRDGWITDEMAVLKRDFLPEQLLAELQGNRVEGCVAVQADQSEQETLFLLDLAHEHNFIRGVVGWVDLRAERVAERLAFFSRFPKLCGFRHIVQTESDDRFLLRPDFLRGIGALGEFGFTYDILIYPRQLPAAVELAAKFPEQKFVLDHIAKPGIKAKEMDGWERWIRELASRPNVACKVSGLVTEADWHAWTATDFRPYLDVVFDCFGSERVMFGSDWPACLLAGSYGQVKGIVEDYTEGWPAAEKEKLFGGNAAEFYGLAA